MKRVIFIHGPDGSEVIDISSEKSYETLALAIVNRRHTAGYFLEPTEPTKPTLTYDQVKKLPEGEFRQFGYKTWQDYRSSLARYSEHHKPHWDKIMDCLNSSDGKIAIEILESRKDYEVEGFEIYTVKDTY